MGTVRNLEQLTGRLALDLRRMEANWGSSVPSSSSLGTREDPVVLDDDDEVEVRVEREDTVVPPPWAGTPFVSRSGVVTTLIEIPDVDTDQSIDVMEDRFMFHTGVVVQRGRRIAWPPLDSEDEVVASSEVGEEAELVRDFAGEEAEQGERDQSDEELFAQSAFLQVEAIGSDPAPPFGTPPPDYE